MNKIKLSVLSLISIGAVSISMLSVNASTKDYKNLITEKLKLISEDTYIDLNPLTTETISTKTHELFNVNYAEISNEIFESSIDKNDDFFRYTNFKLKDKLSLDTKDDATADYSESYFAKTQIDNQKNRATEIANIIDSSEKILVETNYLQDNTISYKWSRSLNGIPYNFDFILVILDCETGDLIQASKNFISNEPLNTKASINSKDVENLSLNILEEFDLKGLEIKENNLKIVNEVSDNFEWNPNTKLAYIIEFDYLLNDFISHGYLTLDANTGELLDLVY